MATLLRVTLILLLAVNAGAGVSTVDPSPACGDGGQVVQVVGSRWNPPPVPSEYVLYFDGIAIAQQGPLAPLEQPNLPFVVPLATSVGRHDLAVAIRRTSDNALLEYVTTAFPVPCPTSAEAPKPRLDTPNRKLRHHLAGEVLLIATERNGRLPDDDIRVAAFEYSADGTTWTPIHVEYDPLAEKGIPDAPRVGDWDATWDTTTVTPGPYYLRTVLETFGGQRGEHRVRVQVHPAPVGIITVAAGPTPGSVVFDARQSIGDWPQGCCRRVDWDFGDGSSATGPVVTHTYADTMQTYHVTMQFVTHFGTLATVHDAIAFPGGAPALVGAPPATCRCVGIAIVESGEALGADADRRPGAADVHWPAYGTILDGRRLGPVSRNPGNRPPAGTPRAIGYGFEVVFVTDGPPANCSQIQLVRRTATAGPAVLDNTWTGTLKDLDLDGANDIDADTPAKCAAAGGAWTGPPANACRLTFPKAGPRFGPDNYEQPFTYKAHPDHTIIWHDAPNTTGDSYHADFIALVRGTDGRYCTATYAVDAARTPLTETFTLGATQVGVLHGDVPADGW